MAHDLPRRSADRPPRERPAVFGGMGARRMLVRINAPTTITLTGPGQSMVIDTITLDTLPDLQLQSNGNGNGNGKKALRV